MKQHAQKLEHFSIWLMVFGVVCLCQPWIFLLHGYSAMMILVGLILFNIFSRMRPPPAQKTTKTLEQK
jgi:apolipoprotein N-acyltransferase